MVGPIPARQSRPVDQPTGRADAPWSRVHHPSNDKKRPKSTRTARDGQRPRASCRPEHEPSWWRKRRAP
ncbi:hypothetical protein STVIR_3315 [Streptomyces viridochromogenes Tue57]|uniref:Uncharacterized protein n=1 Tax=Streptomyces viridochromogenes Tue57 TaxID=1160705 RepID=L8PK53_STRVR|nr:hypothetical protein STVIR_3315 [Streptomyces viridochromogenes Tue57]